MMETPYRFDGRALRRLREERDVSRQELARRANLSRAYIYMLEAQEGEASPTRRPSYDVVLRLARALEVDSTDFGSSASGAEKPGPAGSGAAPASRQHSPKELDEAASRFDIPAEDVRQLAAFRFRGRSPQSPADWAYLWMAMLKSVGLDLK